MPNIAQISAKYRANLQGRINEKLFLPMTQGAVAGLLTFDDAEPPAADEGEGGEA